MSNNLIKILAEQAGATIMERSGGTDYGTLDFDVEKFAELIIRECASIAFTYEQPKIFGIGIIIGNQIEERFGVE